MGSPSGLLTFYFGELPVRSKPDIIGITNDKRTSKMLRLTRSIHIDDTTGQLFNELALLGCVRSFTVFAAAGYDDPTLVVHFDDTDDSRRDLALAFGYDDWAQLVRHDGPGLSIV